MTLLQSGGSLYNHQVDEDADVMIYPTFQQEAVNLTSDYNAMKSVLQTASTLPSVNMFLTSGYVNFPKEIVDILAEYPSPMKFLFAAPQANSFFNDPGFASVIAALYNVVGIGCYRIIIRFYSFSIVFIRFHSFSIIFNHPQPLTNK